MSTWLLIRHARILAPLEAPAMPKRMIAGVRIQIGLGGGRISLAKPLEVASVPISNAIA